MQIDKNTPSTRPYLVRALYEWCTDNGFTPYVAVKVDESVRVPMDHVKNGEIVLNISFDATSSLQLGNELIEFKARFGGVAQDIRVPINRVIAIYARENGQGMAFPVEAASSPRESSASESSTLAARRTETTSKRVQLVPHEASHEEDKPEPPHPTGRTKPALTRIK
jgi:stringent starvation protein B